MVAEIARDVQNEAPLLPLIIDRVGVKGVKRRVKIGELENPSFFDVEINAYVDLPRDRRGVHMSRIIEAILDAVKDERVGEYKNLCEVLKHVGRGLLSRHPYSRRVEVEFKTMQYMNVDDDVEETVNVSFFLLLHRKGKVEWRIKVEVEGMTVCPCAQAVYSSLEKVEPTRGLSHTQRTRLSIDVKTFDRPASVDWLVKAALESFSSPVHSLLKRRREYEVVKSAFEKPRFIEDTVRRAFFLTVRKLVEENFGPETEVEVVGESYESVHPFNAYASKKGTLREALKETSLEKPIS
ncbi:GTP cyclohydrolase I FolE2 [Candidatus Bathyarchaeota archaeon]|nr:MAG: GTP cyclohydrolase I FolE2 [Candidatus Bathyarchaeota archaeon]